MSGLLAPGHCWINPNTWYLKGNKTSTLVVAATAGGKLKKTVTETLRGVLAPDKGETMVIERGGKPLLSGLKKRDPFITKGCKYNDIRCIVDQKVHCTATGTCYAITCDSCGFVEIDTPASTPLVGRQARWAADR